MDDKREPGYHVRDIAKGVLGEPSKIREELEEFEDAVEQGCKLMALIELSDMLGAVDAYLKKHHPGIGLIDIHTMTRITQRVFENGHR